MVLVSPPLQQGDASEEQEGDHHKEGADHCHPLCAIQDCCTDDECPPPDTNLTQVIRVPGDLPQANVAPLILSEGIFLEDGLLVVCNGFTEKSHKEDYGSNHICSTGTSLQCNWRVDEDHGQTDNVDPNNLEYPEEEKLDGAFTDFVKATVFANVDYPD